MDWAVVVLVVSACITILGLASAVICFAWLSDKRLDQTVSMCMTWSDGERIRLANQAEIEQARARAEAKNEQQDMRTLVRNRVEELFKNGMNSNQVQNGTIPTSPNLM